MNTAKTNVKMQTWVGWCGVDQDGFAVSRVYTSFKDIKKLSTVAYPGERIARVEVRELTPKKARRT